jgi:sugar/nucleoside kinase (ribokinase family)
VTSPKLDIVAIGDAIVDVIATCDEAFLAERGLQKGSMRLLDTQQADELYAAMASAREFSGGSAANSMAGVAALGLRAGFIGQVADDQLGDIFAHDMRALGVHFETPPLTGGPPTGRCLILVTPDAQRTMNTCPGASHELAPQALDEEMIRSAAILYLEGYLWGPERPRAAMLRGAEIAHRAGRKVAFTLSESLCIPGRREGVQGLIDAGAIDLLFANEDEVRHLAGSDDLERAVKQLSASIATLVVTRGAAGAIAIEGGERVEVPAAPVERIVDTTGAGDLFAAGFLAARCRGHGLERCLRSGALAAAEVISHFGARPEADLKQLVQL